jgi:hypothetical protein
MEKVIPVERRIQAMDVMVRGTPAMVGDASHANI